MKAPKIEERIARMPMLKILIPFILGILVAQHVTLPLLFLVGVFALCTVAALLLSSGGYLFVALLSCGMSLAEFHWQRVSPCSLNKGICEIKIESSTPRYRTATGIVTALYDDSLQRWEEMHRPVLIRTDSLLELHPGERIVALTSLTPLNAGKSDFLAHLYRAGYRTCVSLSDSDLLHRRAASPHALRTTALRHFQHLGIEGWAGSVSKALAVADRVSLPPHILHSYSYSGMSHLLALSGLHIAILFIILNVVTRWLSLFLHGHLLRSAILVAILWLYVLAAGAPPSAVRAAVMCSFLQFTLHHASSYDGVNTLAAAALVLLTWNPLLLNDIGFQLSFTAVAGIIIRHGDLRPRPRQRFALLRIVGDMLSVGFTATIVTAPLVSHIFGYIPLWGVLLNPIVIPLTAVILLVASLWYLLPIPLIAPLLQGIAEGAAHLLNGLADLTHRLPLSTLELRLSGAEVAGIYSFFVLIALCKWYFDGKKELPLSL